MPSVLDSSEGTNSPLREVVWGKEGGVSGGGFDHRTDEEDGPVTGEALASARPSPVSRRAGAPAPTHGTWRAPVSSACGHRTRARIEVSPRKGIGIKLGIDSHGQFKGFVLLFQALSEGLRGGAPFSRRLGRQTLSGRTGTLQKAVQVQLGLKNRLHPTLC